jgi:iron(III) transport system substrate-binding protein
LKARLVGLLAAFGVAFGFGQASAAPPSYYPDGYQKIIEDSKKETGLLVYSNIALRNWTPIIQAFNKEYPWIKVETTDMRANEVFERYYADDATGVKSADILLAAAPLSWLEFMPKNRIAQYDSPEKKNLPDWSMPAPSIYTISTDPFVIAYNKLLLPEAEWPKSIDDLVRLSQKRPDLRNRLGTYAPNASTYTQGLYWSVVNRHGEKAFEWFKQLGPITEPYRSTGPVLEKITTGEFLAGYFVQALNLVPYISDPARARLMGWSFPSDAAVVYMRNLAIATTAKSPNSAKLLLDFILSKPGQTAVGIGGLLPYRADVDDPKAFPLNGLSYQKLIDQVGEKNVILIDFDPKIEGSMPQVSARLDQLFKPAK